MTSAPMCFSELTLNLQPLEQLFPSNDLTVLLRTVSIVYSLSEIKFTQNVHFEILWNIHLSKNKNSIALLKCRIVPKNMLRNTHKILRIYVPRSFNKGKKINSIFCPLSKCLYFIIDTMIYSLYALLIPNNSSTL